MRIVTAIGLGLLVALCVLRRHDLGAAIGAVSPQALGALAALHLASLVHIAVADVPILLLEAAGAAALLGMTGAWWAPAGALTALLGAHLAAGRRATRGLAVLVDVRRRAALAVLVGCIVGCGLARVWLVLVVAHLDASPGAAAAAFGAMGVFGLLPLGPSAPPAALLVVGGTGAGASALAAGLALSATSIAAVLVYWVVLAVASRRRGDGWSAGAGGVTRREQHHRGKESPGAGDGPRGAESLRGSRAFRNTFRRRPQGVCDLSDGMRR